MDRRTAVPFDPYYFEREAQAGRRYTTTAAFRKIYASNHWGASARSGGGASFDQAAAVLRQLEALIEQLDVRTLLDVPCGDFAWMQHLKSDVRYIGGDVLPELVVENEQRWSGPRRRFRVTDVLSEGESRALSLASFLTELSTAPTKSAIIFDDPVSSLDHQWRENIGHRLVAEAKERQVVVFTHDLLFLHILMGQASRQEVDCSHQHVRREGSAGVSSADLPWLAMGVKDRIGVLNNRLQAATATFKKGNQDGYESEAREIFGQLRETWERAIPEILLNDVVERFRPAIKTQQLAPLHDITEEDCKAVDAGMTSCSRWLRGHDEAPADGTPFPKPDQLKQHIEDLEKWRTTIIQRRQKKQKKS